MSGLEDLYREIILDHYSNPRHRGELQVPPATRTEGFNPLCGDETVVYLEIKDNSIANIAIGGRGCSISQSSASMMSQLVHGKSLDEVRDFVKIFKMMLSIHESSLGSVTALANQESNDPGDGSIESVQGESVQGESQDGDSRLLTPEELASLGDLAALQGVVKFPVRIKCALLPWNTLTQSIEEALELSP
jgi:nitrogen fixation NifU-like protein